MTSMTSGPIYILAFTNTKQNVIQSFELAKVVSVCSIVRRQYAVILMSQVGRKLLPVKAADQQLLRLQ